MPSTRAGEFRAVRAFENAPLLGEHFGDLAGEHHQHERARVIGGLDEIAQAFRDGDARALGVPHVFTGDGARQRRDAVRRRAANAAFASRR